MIGRLGEDCLDPLEEFLDRCFAFDLENRSDIQTFIHHFESNKDSIKRELDEGQNLVRIMTVHGSKGLQAPIVFLPDTVITSHEKSKISSFLWTQEQILKEAPAHGISVPLWTNKASESSSIYRKARDVQFDKNMQEYDRLLYVAMTRAEDRLYVSGCLKSHSTKALPQSWYYTIKDALQSHPECQVKSVSDDNINGDNTKNDEILFYQRPQKDGARLQAVKPLLFDKITEDAEKSTPFPSGFLSAPAEEPDPPKPLQPSRATDSEEEEAIALSPLKAQAVQKTFKRGVLIHALLQFLPNLDIAQRHDAMLRFMTKHYPDASAKNVEALWQEINSVLSHPDYAPLFGEHSRAEVPITGKMIKSSGKMHIISGQIDRLVVLDESRRILVVDYKTNRPAPRDPSQIPVEYRNQLHAYKTLLRDIYPDYDVRCYLLWTDYAAMMEVA